MKNQPYDIIGDIHGHAGKLEALLGRLGYVERGGSFSHPERKIVFLGDLIDRGPRIARTLGIVRGMVDAGAAHAVMGNHEFNALAFHTPDGKGGWLRPRTPTKCEQHAATLEQLAGRDPGAWRGWLDWFAQLPLALDLGGLRAVHAAWDPECVRAFAHRPRIEGELLVDMSRKRTPAGAARETLLNGVEITLPKGHVFHDKSNTPRPAIRTRWWVDSRGRTYRDVVFPACDDVPALPVPEELANTRAPYPADAPPVFFGHYWLPATDRPAPLAPNIACLDHGAGKDGPLVAYRWDGEQTLLPEKFVIGRA